MYDTIIGVLGLSASAYQIWTGKKEAQHVRIRLDELDRSIETVRKLLETRFHDSQDGYLANAWNKDTNEVAIQIVRRAIKLTTSPDREITIVVADPRRARHAFQSPSTIRAGAQTTIVLPPCPQRLLRSAPGGYENYFNSPEEGGEFEIINPEPIILRTPNNPEAGRSAWGARLANIGIEQIETAEILIDGSYWKSRLAALGLESSEAERR